VLRVAESKRAEAFYCGQLGFKLDFVNRGDADDPCYFGVSRDGVALHLSSHGGDSVPGAAVNVMTGNIDALYRAFVATGVPIALAPTDQTWGAREMYIRDPDQNALRFIQAS
jgi:catechol 2,3-dioxygenase-like lactoylglutathione lyase family enzyme